MQHDQAGLGQNVVLKSTTVWRYKRRKRDIILLATRGWFFQKSPKSQDLNPRNGRVWAQSVKKGIFLPQVIFLGERGPGGY